MNREIKFRAWHQNEMIYCDKAVYFVEFDGTLWKNNGKEYDNLISIDKAVLMQYTGLKDKNGTEIYEGDIVFNSNRTLVTLKEDKRLYLVKWQNGEYDEEDKWLCKKPAFIFDKIITNGIKYMELIFNQNQIEVVGNIYQNPELLNSKS